MPLDKEVDLGLGDIVLDGDPAPPSKRAHPQYSVHVCCGQMAGWIKTPLATEIGLSSGHILLDGDPASHGKGHSTPFFLGHVYCGQTVAHLSYCCALVVSRCKKRVLGILAISNLQTSEIY